MSIYHLASVTICLFSLLVGTNACNQKRAENKDVESPQNQPVFLQEKGFDTTAFMEKWGYDTIINEVFISYAEEIQGAEPKIGFEAFDSMMLKKKQLPQYWISQGIEGIVRVTIYVDELGELSFGQIWDFGYGSDTMAVNLIRSLGPWNPAISLETGEPVIDEIIVPVSLH